MTTENGGQAMNHDITHCRGIGCPIKDDCYRYEAHLEVESGKYQSTRISYYYDGTLCKRAELKLMEELQ